MAKRRTREQKKHAKRRIPVSPATSMRQSGLSTTAFTGPRSSAASGEILSVPSRHIITDLVKTVILSLLFITIILILYWYIAIAGTPMSFS